MKIPIVDTIEYRLERGQEKWNWKRKIFCKILGDNNITRVNLIELIEDIYDYRIAEIGEYDEEDSILYIIESLADDNE